MTINSFVVIDMVYLILNIGMNNVMGAQSIQLIPFELLQITLKNRRVRKYIRMLTSLVITCMHGFIRNTIL